MWAAGVDKVNVQFFNFRFKLGPGVEFFLEATPVVFM